jgi:plastocyanin
VRRYGLILASAVLLATGVAGSAVAGVAPGGPATTTSASTAGLSPAKRAAKRRAVRNCRRIRNKKRRTTCIRRVQRRFKPRPVTPPVVQGPIAATIDVRDKYFSPSDVSIRSGQSILWNWNMVNKDAHNVDLVSAPVGVNRIEFSTPSSPSRGFQFRRTFKIPGTYDFVCSIHHLMTMTVLVSK